MAETDDYTYDYEYLFKSMYFYHDTCIDWSCSSK